MTATIDIVVPDLGDSEAVEVIEVLVGAGDSVAREDGLISVESDKAAMDVPAPDAGVIAAITVNVGDTVSSGDVIGTMTVQVDDTVIEKPPAMDAEPEPAAVDDGSAADAPVGQQTLVVPDLGDFDDVEVIEVHISAGDTIAVDDPLVTLETDKAAMDVPAVYGGTIESVSVAVGDTVSEGSALAVIDAVAAAAPAATPAAPAKSATTAAPAVQSPPPPAPPRELPPINEAGFARAHASPSVRKLARELGVDLTQVKGTGLKNRVMHDDVKAFVKAILTGQSAAPAGATLPKTPVVDFAKFGDVEEQPLTRIQKISGPRLQASWINLPHVTQHDEADITGLEARRQELKGPAREKGIPLTPLAFILRACVAALREFPKMNSSLAEDGKRLIHKKYIHLGFAADTEQGLMVPVIRDADKKDVYELAEALRDLSAAARDGKLKSDQLQGATFTISSLGGIGGTAFTPIVNAPEVGILGVSRSKTQPVWDGKAFQPRLMLPFGLSYDHRVIDGAYAVRFTTFLAEQLANVDGLIEAAG